MRTCLWSCQRCKKLVATKVRVTVIAQREQTTDIPEYQFLKGDPNFEAVRGLGATVEVPVSSGAEENLLCYPSDTYVGENIFVHEFGHTIKEMGIETVDKGFRAKVQQQPGSSLGSQPEGRRFESYPRYQSGLVCQAP